jgi:DNA repair protein RecN (Recombination protein N)
MLRELRIKNLAIIDDLKVRFDHGFNVLTGETGAGKSIIVDSLGLALGSKIQPDLLRTAEKEAIVQAYFEPEGFELLPDIGIDMSEGLVLRRSIFSTGKSRAYINDTMVSTQSLAEVGKALVDIHGQHEHQSLLNVDRHRVYLDLFGRLQENRAQVERLYREVDTLRREVDSLHKRGQERSDRLDLLKFQVQEIDSAALAPGEIEQLTEQRKILSNFGRLKELADSAYGLLYAEDDACMAKLALLMKKLQEMAAIDHHASEVLDSLKTASPLLDDAAVSLRGYKDRFEYDPGSRDEIEDRLALIRKFEKKYGAGIEAILSYRDNADAEIKSFKGIDGQTAALENELFSKKAFLSDAAEVLSAKRKEAALRMERLVSGELKELAFNNALFLIDMHREDITQYGIDRIEFLFSANAGEPPKPLAKIASGGELSRVMLALKTVFAELDSTPVLIFDEIDSGIGGKTAEVVGRKLRNLAGKHQVLCTTHLPQLACKAANHLRVEKRQKKDRASVEVRELSGSDRLNEIARMLSGNITDISLRHAKELIESAA